MVTTARSYTRAHQSQNHTVKSKGNLLTINRLVGIQLKITRYKFGIEEWKWSMESYQPGEQTESGYPTYPQTQSSIAFSCLNPASFNLNPAKVTRERRHPPASRIQWMEDDVTSRGRGNGTEFSYKRIWFFPFVWNCTVLMFYRNETYFIRLPN